MVVASRDAAVIWSVVILMLQLYTPFTCGALDLIDVVKLGSVNRAAVLLEGGAPVSSRDNIGWTPLHNAANSGNVELVKLLLKYNADIDAKDVQYGRTALHLSASNGNEKVIESLLEEGAAVNATDVNGQTPLHLASWNGQLGASLILLNRHADINAQDKYGSTPIRLAAIQQFDKVIKALLFYCPDLRLTDNKGITVVEFVKEKELHNIIAIFEEHRKSPCSRHKLQNVARRVQQLTHNEEKCKHGERQFPDAHVTYSWRLRETPAGEVAIISCPGGSNGTAKWSCDIGGRWHRTPDLSKCHSLLFSGWQEVLATDNITAAEVVTTIVSSLRDSRRVISLAPGDLITITEILDKLHEKHRQDLKRMTSGIEAWKLSMKYLDGIMESMDIMLTKPALWWGLDQHTRTTTFSRLQYCVTFATALLASHQMNSVQDFAVQSLSTRVMHRPLDYFKSILLSYRHPKFNKTILSLPHNFYETYPGDGEGKAMIAFVGYNDIHCSINTVPCLPEELQTDRDLPAASQVNSAIIGAVIGEGSTWHAPLDEIIAVQFQHIYSGDKYILGARTCVWWDGSSHSWATDGCKLVSSNDHFSLCHCDRLTNLAVIMDIHGVISDSTVMAQVLRCITIVSCVVSIVSLALCVICFVAFRDIRFNTLFVIRGNLCMCLIFSELVVLGGLDVAQNKLICTILAALLHYCFLATFTWSSVEAFHAFFTYTKVFSPRASQLEYYFAVGYLTPLLYVILTVAFTRARGYSYDKICWLSPQGLIWNFAVPLAVILLLIATAYLSTMYVAWCKDQPQTHVPDDKKSSSSRSTTARSRDSDAPLWKNLTCGQEKFSGVKKKRNSTSSMPRLSVIGGPSSNVGVNVQGGSGQSLGRRIGGSITVLLLLCLAWLSGFLYFLDGSHTLAMIFTTLNSLQGVFIFVLHIVMNPRIMREVKSVLK